MRPALGGESTHNHPPRGAEIFVAPFSETPVGPRPKAQYPGGPCRGGFGRWSIVGLGVGVLFIFCGGGGGHDTGPGHKKETARPRHRTRPGLVGPMSGPPQQPNNPRGLDISDICGGRTIDLWLRLARAHPWPGTLWRCPKAHQARATGVPLEPRASCWATMRWPPVMCRPGPYRAGRNGVFLVPVPRTLLLRGQK